jgi:serine/threonine protein kinase
MAPELIVQDSYDIKADIWSLGITAIELATGKPPYHNLHPMQALFIIPSRAPPKIPSSEEYSEKFHDFLSCCLQKDPKNRKSSDELLLHPFLAGVADKLSIEGVGEQVMAQLQTYRKNVLKKEQQSNVRKSEDQSEVGTVSYESGTVRHITDDSLAKYSGTLTSNYDTMIINPSSESNLGTMKLVKPLEKTSQVSSHQLDEHENDFKNSTTFNVSNESDASNHPEKLSERRGAVSVRPAPFRLENLTKQSEFSDKDEEKFVSKMAEIGVMKKEENCLHCRKAFSIFRRRYLCSECKGYFCGDCASMRKVEANQAARLLCKICASKLIK